VLGQGTPDRIDFAVRGGVVELTSAIAPARKDVAVTHDHRPVRKIRLARFLDRDPHECLVIRRSGGRDRRMMQRHNQSGCGCRERRQQRSPASRKDRAMGAFRKRRHRRLMSWFT
jgi:hypothetical protein